MSWDKLATEDILAKTIDALVKNGINVSIVNTGEEAKNEILKLIPEGSEVMTNVSKTLDAIGVASYIDQSGKYKSLRLKLSKMDRKTQDREMKKLAAAPEFAIGSVHGVTSDGHVLIASAGGSQLPSYAYTAGKVIWVVGTQKIVKNTDQGIKRIYEYCLPLESERAMAAYGIKSSVNKILIINKEGAKDRTKIIFVREKLGF